MPSGHGYWIVGADGSITAYEDARAYGSLPAIGVVTDDIVGIASSEDGQGYWMAEPDGEVYAFGDAAFYGSVPDRTCTSVTSSRSWPPRTATATGWSPPTGGLRLRRRPVLRLDGGHAAECAGGGDVGDADRSRLLAGGRRRRHLSFGSAAFLGSTGSLHLNEPIVAIAGRPTGRGYWLVAADGGLFAFTAPFYGSTGGTPPPVPVVGMVPAATGGSYLLVDGAGTAFPFPHPEHRAHAGAPRPRATRRGADRARQWPPGRWAGRPRGAPRPALIP